MVIPSVFKYKNKYICPTCFNKSTEKFRNGKGARDIGWQTGFEKKAPCYKCKKIGIISEED